MGAEATLRPDRLPVVPGGEVQAEISVRNTGPVVDSFALSVLGEAARWAVCEPGVLSLFPGQNGTARIVVRPPHGSDVPYGPVLFGVRAASSEDPLGSVVQEGVLDIAPQPVVTADMSPRTGRARGMRASRHVIAVDNQGNSPAVIELAGCDEADTADVRVRPAELEVPPGSTAFARVRVRARRRFWRGPAVTHRFQVITQPPGGVPFRSDGTLVQEAVLPGWLPKAIAVACAAAIAAVALWFGVLRPVVTNAATSAGAAAAQQTVKALQSHAGPVPAKNGAGAGPAPPGSSPKPKASVSSKPRHKTRTGAGPPVPFAQTLDARQPVIVAPARHALALTDLVMQNPAGDQGTLTLSRDGQVLFSEQLADFRDYDLHFITAIMIAPGQNFQFSVSCKNPGGKACTPVVLITGTNSSASS